MNDWMLQVKNWLTKTARYRLVGRLRKRKRMAVEAMTLMAKKAYQGKVPADLSINDDYLYGYGRKA
jgi:predicted RNA polymerase sigma factor